jgi:hypothetical protein
MEDCTNKQDLIEIYKNEYEQKYYKPFLELSLTKLGSLGDNNPVKLTNSQMNDIEEKLNGCDIISKEIFLEGLDVLNYEQICYVGW